MNFYNNLIESLGPPPLSPLGQRPENIEEVAARNQEAARLTGLLEKNPAFSFVRLGDMDLGILIAASQGVPAGEPIFDTETSTGTAAGGCPGISHRNADRLRRAFECADYVDFHERLWPISELLPRLTLQRSPALHRNPDAATSYVLLTWMETEFRSYCQRHRIGFCGAEASVLAHLHQHESFHQSAAAIWPPEICPTFLQPRDDGSNLDQNLDLIKADLIEFIRTHRIDTLFLSLGGAAKILCYELATEVGIRCIDFGAMLRALCYLGSDGNRSARSTHSPFFSRIPFDLVMNAVEAAYPALQPEQMVSKAHAQVILDLQRKEPFWTSASTELEFTRENLIHFRASSRACRKRYHHLYRMNPSTRRERISYLHFCGKHNLTLEGRLFYFWFRIKGLVSRSLRWIAPRTVSP